MQCPVHHVETLLRCGKCDRPICPDCTKFGPVGARCPECAALRTGPLYQVRPDRLALGLVAVLAVAFGIGMLLASIRGFGIFMLWGPLLGGQAIGELILRITGRKRGPKIEIGTGIAATVGVIASFFTWGLTHGRPMDILAIMNLLQDSPFYVIGAVLLVFSAVSRVRFF
jgi:hypothetical protein